MDAGLNHCMQFEICGLSISVSYPVSLSEKIVEIFPQSPFITKSPRLERLDILECGDATYLLRYKNIVLWENLTWPSLIGVLCEEIANLTAARSVDAIVRCGAVSLEETAITILGPTGSGKSSLTAWFSSRGFDYLADNLISLATDHSNIYDARNVISPMTLPLLLRKDKGIHKLAILDPSSDTQPLIAKFKNKSPSAQNEISPIGCGLIVVPRYHPEVEREPQIEALSESDVIFLLNQATHPAQHGFKPNTDRFVKFARSVPAVSVSFNNFDQLNGFLDTFVSKLFSQGVLKHHFADFCRDWQKEMPQESTARAIVDIKPSVPSYPKTPFLNQQKPRLTIGMATYDDFDGVYFTLQALRMYHPEIANDVEFLVVDNNPDGPCGKPIEALQAKAPNFRYIPVRERSGTAVRDYIMAEATSDYVLTMDCHVLLVPGSVARLLKYFDENPDTADLLQGPIVWDELDRISTHMEPSWRAGFLGNWARDERGLDPNGPPFEIPMQGLGLYACRRATWPNFNPKFRGFGGEEGYIHEKYRQAGARTLCLPFLRWLHRFQRPLGVPYKISWEDRVRNYIIGMHELNLDMEPAVEHFRQYLGSAGKSLIEKTMREVER
ncbi:glycosyltransferase [Brucella sp. 21LCYQ03]|nr:glycosyltransferase [Brucella sp. 21LCYQ03]